MNLNDKDYIEELFSDALNQHQVPVDPAIWQGIQSKLAASAVTTSSATSMSLITKGIIAATAVAVVSTASFLFLNTKEDVENKPVNKEEVSNSNIEYEIESIDSQEEYITTYTVPTVTNRILEIEKNIQKDSTLTTTTYEKVNIQTAPTTYENSTTKEPIERIQEIPKSASVVEKVIAPVKANPEVISSKKEAGFVSTWSKTNVFSPNNDGVNDYFFLETSDLKEFSVTILDKDNQVVYQSQDRHFKWDGTNNKGEIVDAGTYSYIVYAIDLNNQSIKQFNLLYITK